MLIEEVLVRHPKLRPFVENAGYPYRDEIAMMTQYQQLHGDVSTISWVLPRAAFYGSLQAVIRAQAPFLAEEQKRDILYRHAVRFLRLEEDPSRARPSKEK